MNASVGIALNTSPELNLQKDITAGSAGSIFLEMIFCAEFIN
jgi:hypothetical protein